MSSEDGHTTLKYACTSVKAQASTAAEQMLVREYAQLVTRDARARGRLSEIDPLMDAYAAGDQSLVEQSVVSYLCTHGDVAASRARTFPEPGSAVVPLTLPRLATPPEVEGTASKTRTFSLIEGKGTIRIINFWGTYCTPCLEKHPEMVLLAEKYKDQGVEVIGVIHREPPAVAARWLRQNGGAGGYQMVVDEEGTAAKLFGVTGIPRTFIITRDGKVADRTWGHSEGLDGKIQALLAAPAT